MDQQIYKYLKNFGKATANFNLAKVNSFKIGGKADVCLEIEEKENLVNALDFLSKEGVGYFVMGGGTNVLFPDEGFEGVVIRVKTNKIHFQDNELFAEAGVSFGTLNMKAAQLSQSGLEWSAGLPGTIGGAVRGNAGSAGSYTGTVIKVVEAYVDGEVVEISAAECGFAYRESIFKKRGGVVLSATFRLVPGDSQKILSLMQTVNERRTSKYPKYPSAGSFFKNVPLEKWSGDSADLPKEFLEKKQIPAGWLNEQCGLKGTKIGGAMVSNEHANFLVNFDHATASDILKLVEEVKSKVYNKFGVELEEEVCIIK